MRRYYLGIYGLRVRMRSVSWVDIDKILRVLPSSFAIKTEG